ncbi:hypothetical protein [Streptomyces sp. wa1002]|nr:hypothetical protein [Streptomyces sp. wa1002]
MRTESWEPSGAAPGTQSRSSSPWAASRAAGASAPKAVSYTHL